LINKNFVVWLIGLSGSGKTTLGKKLFETLKSQGIKNLDFIDGDEIREHIGKIFGYSDEERRKNIQVIQFVVYKLYSNGVNVVVANLSPYEDLRIEFRKKVENYVEVFLDCGIEECKKRDPKGFYKKVDEGKLSDFMGIHQEYEKPCNSDIILDTSKYSILEAEQIILDYIKEKFNNE
jgi:adenylylsulfate kinase